MSETLQLWLFGVMGAWLVVLSAAILRLMLFQEKVQAILTFLSKKSAEILHSPDNHHGLDYYLDEYKKHHHDLTHVQWCELLERCKAIADDPSAKKDERLMAAMFFIIELSMHKTARFSSPQQILSTADKPIN